LGLRRERPRTGCVEDNHVENEEDEKMESYHDYCAVPGPTAVDLVLIEREEMQREIEDLWNKVEKWTVRSLFDCSDFWDQMHRSSPSQGG
jgi:hypothetical protein